MPGFGAWIKTKMFGLAEREIDFSYRGFLIKDEQKRKHLENSGGKFVDGFNIALASNSVDELGQTLRETIDPAFQGFAHEGAAMALWILDWVTPWNRNRFQTFLAGPGEPHYYMSVIGAGWAMGRLPGNFDRRREAVDPFFGWLAADGYGFHEGFFKPEASFIRHETPKKLNPYSYQAFDQGLGRSMWFYCCADVDQIVKTLRAFPKERHASLWAGIGLACTYAGGLSESEIEHLKTEAGDLAEHMAQGCAFACKARFRAGNPVPHNELASRVLCGINAIEAAEITDKALGDWPENAGNRFELWRSRIRKQLAMIHSKS